MHAICSEIMANLDCLHNRQLPLLQLHNGFMLPRPKLYTGMITSTFCLTVTEESTT